MLSELNLISNDFEEFCPVSPRFELKTLGIGSEYDTMDGTKLHNKIAVCFKCFDYTFISIEKQSVLKLSILPLNLSDSSPRPTASSH